MRGYQVLLLAVVALTIAGCSRGAAVPPVSGDAGKASITESLDTLSTGGQPARTPNELVAIGHYLFGSTRDGGIHNRGEVFRVTPQGEFVVLRAFADGASPMGPLAEVNGTLFGTLYRGTASHAGGVFGISRDRDHQEAALYSFAGDPDAAKPQAGLVNVNGTLYGTASGGENGTGSVFGYNTVNGREFVLFSFPSTMRGGGSSSTLTYVNGKLWGTTPFGGQGCNSAGCGTVFAIDPATGKQTFEYDFKNGADGSEPWTGLTEFNGKLYGTTVSGGRGCSFGCGTIYSIDPATGREKVVYAFAAGYPYAQLSAFNGKLYGTIATGGSAGEGAVYVFDPTTSSYTNVYSFQGGSDGAQPKTRLVPLGSYLFGTTFLGGANGRGVVYRVTAGGRERVIYAF
ncbi:MAG TPA: choice-of-anchor tandem repeat GloVer-containing protein [Candidatus Baltobacteraceae bacterium]|jgi:uncharacterized repeat protein (TIGR03803 family)|nr:choice-of-anchor tandem repeat GloVer-containing protein [Candidatus Baltobacteraceae bacterium]